MTITVKVANVPGSIQEVALQTGATVADALRTAGINASGKVIKVGGRDASTTDTLSNGSTVLVSAKITGNQAEDQATLDALMEYAFNGKLCNHESHGSADQTAAQA
jgi:sulfur carrier protein ThiS